jgi:hypothetical protein
MTVAIPGGALDFFAAPHQDWAACNVCFPEGEMQTLEITWGRVLSVWWLLAWRSILGAGLLGAIAGALIGFFGAMGGMKLEIIQAVSTLVGLLIGIP